jgi:hypothetical protein
MMGREIRMVPPNWEHPKDEEGHYIPLFDCDFATAAREWMNNAIAWDNGTHKEAEHKKKFPFYWQWHGDPPSQDSYRPAFSEEPTWFQVYETVSEGTPVTPPFSTKEELVNYLVENGDFSDQTETRWHPKRGGWSRENAEAFVGRGWAPSLMVTNYGDHVEIKSARDGA